MYNKVVIRFGIIFGLLFQSLVLLCCGKLMPVALATQNQASCCSVEPSSDCCCCSSSKQANASPEQAVHEGSCSVADGASSLAQHCARACECPATLDLPRVPPAKSQRQSSLEQLRSNLALQGTPIALPPMATGLKPAIVREAVGPPLEYGRLACERFCRWTI